eukprot:12957361-Alexandrium_andersonii.AAC.1
MRARGCGTRLPVNGELGSATCELGSAGLASRTKRARECDMRAQKCGTRLPDDSELGSATCEPG